jgi:hypothetical protein
LWIRLVVLFIFFILVKRYKHAFAPKDQFDVNEILSGVPFENVQPLARHLRDFPAFRIGGSQLHQGVADVFRV